MNNFYIIPNNKDILLNNLILPLEDYSIGFDVYYKVEEINKLSEKYNISVIINKFMHKTDIENIGGILNKLINIKYFFIEDLGLTYFIPKEKVVISQNHIINNYDSINYFKELGFTSVLINNDLTIEEIKEIISNTSSNLFMYFISKNNLMYSKRHLISSFSDYKNNVLDNKKEISEKVSNYKLLIKEEECGTCIFNSKIFSANKYLDDIACINKIINLSNINEEKTKVILNNYNNKDLDKLLEVDNYFLENKIAYKVGDLND
mgnify:FL=1